MKKHTFFEFKGAMVQGYDRFNHLASAGQDIRWRKATAKHLKSFLSTRKSKTFVLDLATGTGDMAITIGRICTNVKIIGTDPSREMLFIGKEKLEQNHQNSISLVNTVSRLAFPNASFDAVICAFGFRNFTHLKDDLKELYRLLNDNGRIYALEFFQPKTKIADRLLKIYKKTLFPLLGFLLTGQIWPYKYLFSSIVRFKTPEEFSTLLNECQFKTIETQSFFFGLVHLIIAEKTKNNGGIL